MNLSAGREATALPEERRHDTARRSRLDAALGIVSLIRIGGRSGSNTNVALAVSQLLLYETWMESPAVVTVACFSKSPGRTAYFARDPARRAMLEPAMQDARLTAGSRCGPEPRSYHRHRPGHGAEDRPGRRQVSGRFRGRPDTR